VLLLVKPYRKPDLARLLRVALGNAGVDAKEPLSPNAKSKKRAR
jgi:hypothetical protein